MAEQRTCGKALMVLLADYGVDTVFGMPGTHTVELYRGIAGAGMRHVQCRNEMISLGEYMRSYGDRTPAELLRQQQGPGQNDLLARTLAAALGGSSAAAAAGSLPSNQPLPAALRDDPLSRLQELSVT